MTGYLFFLLLSVSLAKSAIYYVKENEFDDEPVNLKFTKLLDVKIESKANSWKNDFSTLLHSQIDESDAGKKDNSIQIPMKLTFGIDKNKIQKVYEKNTSNLLNYTEGCKALVGVSKIPFCTFLERSDIKKNLPKNCREIKENGNNKSGIYEIQPRASNKPLTVLCDMETKDGGWTHIQKRFDGSEDFFRGWRDYKHGFGDLNGEFWIGLENIYHLTGFETNELLVELTDRDQKIAYAHYKTFAITAEKEGYSLGTLTGFSGDAGDALVGHLKAKFTTKDVDQDTNPGNCAVMYDGAWWYTSCHTSNLNGKYMNSVLSDAYMHHGLNWNGFRGHEYNLAGSRMLVRPIES